ncbi:hypothetical protein E5288_WYG003736 [Bos mutus]|uniref:Gap junction delta-2 protein n=1 Tax=Bos mutus TaxID=72004 RepID=A0A6B0RF98_9CETA|nr:hypothetical protein [Bos mutus]
MGEWTILERLLEAAVQQHSTMIGRILLTVVVIFRILIVAIVGETVYDDEQTMFVCNTLQPGCNQACYDRAFPISHIRYWVFQIIMVCTPSLCFITYSVHQSAKQRERRYSTVFLALDRDPPESMGGPGGTGVSGICVVLNLAELNHLGWRKIKLAVRGAQAKRKSVYEIRNKDLPRVSVPNFGRTQSSDSAYV